MGLVNSISDPKSLVGGLLLAHDAIIQVYAARTE